MFGESNWTVERRRSGEAEQAIVPVEVYVEGENLGWMNFKIDHAHYRVANQNNVPTWLHWGPLRDTLERHDYTDYWVKLEALPNNVHRMQITGESPE